MALRCTKLLKFFRNTRNTIQKNFKSSAVPSEEEVKTNKFTQFKTENNIIFKEHPDIFGTLNKVRPYYDDKLDDEGDIKEHQYLENIPLWKQKLTIHQYSNIIKQYLSHKRLKEAIDVLEVRMLTVDRVKPENYIYNILIGACADVGYTKKAFKLYNDMKRRALKPTGDTYTCLFHACANSPWPADGLKNAQHLRDLMIEKGIEPNLTNYNAMIKAFGRCGDLKTAFQIVDEMITKKIKIRVQTFNHLLQACITDKNSGLRHAIIVWRKMLKMREKPNIYSFNLMLKCVKDCNLGSKSDIEELIGILRNISIGQRVTQPAIESLQTNSLETSERLQLTDGLSEGITHLNYLENRNFKQNNQTNESKELTVQNEHKVVLVPSSVPTIAGQERNVPNLLSRVIQMHNVTGLKEVHTVQEKFAIVGGQDDFFKEMEVYSVKPDIKTFTQMLLIIDDTCEAELKLLETMKASGVREDIDFYNLLIKKRCLRSDYDGALDVKRIIEEENKARKKRHPLKKKIRLKYNIMTYGVLALACRTKESAEELLRAMKEDQLKVNMEILGALLKSAAIQMNFSYVLYVMDVVREENLKVNSAFIRHLETFTGKCATKAESLNENRQNSGFKLSYKKFLSVYQQWLKEINIDEALKPEHPWQQFEEKYPETVQRQNTVIREPKKFYKRNKKYVPYSPIK